MRALSSEQLGWNPFLYAKDEKLTRLHTKSHNSRASKNSHVPSST